MLDLRSRIRIDNVRARSTYGTAPYNPTFPESDNWTVTLYRRDSNGHRKQLTIPFYTGQGLRDELADGPGPAVVLECLLSDAVGYVNASGFQDWASDYGYDPDSRKAEHTYRQVGKLTERLSRWLGEDFDDYLFRTEF